MNLYENLPVYKKALDLAVYFETIVRHFDRCHKYKIGADLCNTSRRILVLVATAYTKAKRREALIEAIELLEELKILIQLCKEIKAFRSFKSYENSIRKTIEVVRQCGGWLKSQNSSG